MRTAAVTGLATNGAFGKTAPEPAGGDVSVTLRMMQEQRGTTDLQGMIDLRRHVPIVERRRHQAGFQAGEVVNDERRAIGHQRRDAVAGLQTKREILIRQPGTEFIELSPTQARRGRDERQIVGFRLQTVAQQTHNWNRASHGRSGKGHHLLLEASYRMAAGPST